MSENVVTVWLNGKLRELKFDSDVKDHLSIAGMDFRVLECGCLELAKVPIWMYTVLCDKHVVE